MTTLDDLENIDPKMLWRQAALEQIKDFKTLGSRLLGLPMRAGVDLSIGVAETHSSKSIHLPVLELMTTERVLPSSEAQRRVRILDNFYELDLHYFGPPVELSYEECGYTAMTKEAYLHEIERCEGYSWKGWTQTELEDPRIGRVLVTHENGNTYWNSRDFDAKERWLKRFESAEWYDRDWSRSPILGNVAKVLAGDEPCLWVAHSTYDRYEGPYKPNTRKFSLAFGSSTMLEHEGLIRKLLGI